MYLTPEELKSHMYAHIVEEITEGDEQIVLQAIEAAVEEVRSYLRPRYDTDRIFAAEGSERNALVLENTKIVTVWNLIKLSNVETIYEYGRSATTVSSNTWRAWPRGRAPRVCRC